MFGATTHSKTLPSHVRLPPFTTELHASVMDSAKDQEEEFHLSNHNDTRRCKQGVVVVYDYHQSSTQQHRHGWPYLHPVLYATYITLIRANC